MAFVLPVFIFTILGIFDFGRAMHAWGTLNYQCVRAAREATKRTIPSIRGYGVNTHTSHEDVVKTFWAYRSPMMAQSDYVLPGSFTGVGVATSTVEVSASYNLSLITPLVGSLLGEKNGSGILTIRATAHESKE